MPSIDGRNYIVTRRKDPGNRLHLILRPSAGRSDKGRAQFELQFKKMFKTFIIQMLSIQSWAIRATHCLALRLNNKR